MKDKILRYFVYRGYIMPSYFEAALWLMTETAELVLASYKVGRVLEYETSKIFPCSSKEERIVEAGLRLRDRIQKALHLRRPWVRNNPPMSIAEQFSAPFSASDAIFEIGDCYMMLSIVAHQLGAPSPEECAAIKMRAKGFEDDSN